MLHANPRASPLWALVRAIAAGDRMVVAKMLATSQGLARERAVDGATRQAAQAHYLHEIGHYFMPAIPHCISPRPPIKKTSLQT